MKKHLVSITIAIVLLVVSGCMGPLVVDFQPLGDGLKMKQIDGGVEVYASESYHGIQLTFDQVFLSSYDSLEVDAPLYHLKKNTPEGLLLSLVKKGVPIEKNTLLFTVPTIEQENIKEIEILTDVPEKRAVLPLPEGISVLDSTVSPN